MRIRLIASDVDGTLLDADSRLPESNRRAVRAARRAGLAVVLCTGKSDHAIRGLVEELGLADLPHATLNGGCLYHPARDEREVLHAIPPGAAWATAARLGAAGLPVAFYAPARILALGFEGTGFARRVVEMGEPEPEPVASAEEARAALAGEPLVKLLTLLPAGAPGAAALERRLAAGAPAGVRFVRTGPEYFEAIPEGAGKGAALRRIAGLLGVRREEILAVGDAESDLALFEAAGLRVAVANAAPEVARAADITVAAAAEGGVAEAIRRLALSGKGADGVAPAG